MDLFELVRTRQSVRAFSAEPIPSETIRRILDPVSLAPSAGNLQAYEVVVVTASPQKRQLARAAAEQQFIAEAAAVLVFSADLPRSAARYRERGEQLYAVQDATIACTYAMLVATALGVASVWVGAFNEARVREIVEGSSTSRPVALLVLGYAAESPPRRSRRPLSQMVTFLPGSD